MPRLRFRAVAGARRGQESVFSGPRVRIGRSRDNDLILPERDNPLSSGHHAEALLDSSGAWSIVDLKTPNGTAVNDVAVDRHPLRSGDRVTFGDQEFVVSIGGLPRAQIWTAGIAIVIAAAAIAAGIDRMRARPSFESMAATAPQSVFLVALEDHGVRSVVGTAFAVDARGVLATNAHVADALRKRALTVNGGPRAVAIQSDSYVVRNVASVVMHPDWHDGSLKGDVALLRLDAGSALAPLHLADKETVATLRRGSPIAAFGFPAVSTDPAHPRGRLTVDVVGDLRGEYIEVGLGVSPGTSGSPIFDQSGVVIAIVAGGDFVDAPAGLRPSGSAANWALSVGLLEDLLAAHR